jgi:hypothetical protein
MSLRQIYQDKADAQLQEWQAWIEEYKSQVILTGTSSRINQQQMRERLDDGLRIAQVRLEELRGTQEEHWEFAKQAVERAMIDLKKLLDESGGGQAGRVIQLQPSRAHVYEPFSKKG